ncbi:MAG TPA: hypothetical protein VFW97_16185 [Acidimicrobiia bacterium]|jgi:hypothetical protein|nr:hypothetical protein [Acidimicrobiia bacterium]
MTDRSFFSDEEWAALTQAPLHVTMAVVAVAEHGPIALVKEASATAKALTRPGDHGPANELIAAIAHEAEGHDARHAAKGDRGSSPDAVIDEALAELAPATAAIAKLPIAEAAEVRDWLIGLAQAVAGAAKGTSEKEQAVVERVRVALGAPPANS